MLPECKFSVQKLLVEIAYPLSSVTLNCEQKLTLSWANYGLIQIIMLWFGGDKSLFFSLQIIFITIVILWT